MAEDNISYPARDLNDPKAIRAFLRKFLLSVWPDMEDAIYSNKTWVSFIDSMPETEVVERYAAMAGELSPDYGTADYEGAQDEWIGMISALVSEWIDLPEQTPAVVQEQMRQARDGTVTAAGGQVASYPKTLASFLSTHGHLIEPTTTDEVPSLTAEAMTALTGAANAVLSALYEVPQEGFEWDALVGAIDEMTSVQRDHVLEIAFPNEAEKWVVVRAQSGDGYAAVPQLEYDLIDQQLPTLTTANKHGAILAGHIADVRWDLILFAAEELGRIEPSLSPPALTEQGTREPGDPAYTVTDFESVAASIKAGLQQYDGREVFALIHAVDPALARNLHLNAYSLSVDEIDRVQGILKDFSRHSAQNGTPPAPGDLSVIDQLQPGGFEEEVRETKPESVRESYRNLYKEWFLKDPSEQDLDEFTDHFDKQLEDYQRQKVDAIPSPWEATGDWSPGTSGAPGAPMGVRKPDTPGFEVQQPDVSVSARRYLRSEDMYQALFDKMPGHMSEEDYVTSMTQAATTSMGGSAGAMAGESIRAGMATGDPSAVARHALLSGQGRTSSTFNERLARAAKIFERMT